MWTWVIAIVILIIVIVVAVYLYRRNRHDNKKRNHRERIVSDYRFGSLYGPNASESAIDFNKFADTYSGHIIANIEQDLPTTVMRYNVPNKAFLRELSVQADVVFENPVDGTLELRVYKIKHANYKKVACLESKIRAADLQQGKYCWKQCKDDLNVCFEECETYAVVVVFVPCRPPQTPGNMSLFGFSTGHTLEYEKC